ncbi:MAG: intradiol ring-cleavage dioxygenase [Deltaproteobacteria bacterium]|nr:intradiol ring-cleavage dioxygenase [Deltaproteobacteria bacterium]
MATPCAGRFGGKGQRRRFPVVLVPVACLFVLTLVGLPGPARGEEGKCVPTAEDAEGPFYKAGAPERLSTGSGLAVSGKVLSYPGCRPIPGARVEWWHADRSGQYVDSLRGMQKTGATGSYTFTTSPPGVYPGRPPHIHFKAFAPGHKPLITQLYLHGGAEAVRFDLVVETDQWYR